jgi:hypothetical protein
MKDCLGIVANYSCVLWSVGRVCLKLRVGFNPEVAEGTEKTGRNGIYCAHGAQHAAPLQVKAELRLDRVGGGAYKHERAKDETRMFEPSTPGKYLSWEPLEHVYAA